MDAVLDLVLCRRRFVALRGAPGWGKTHLALAVVAALEESGRSATVLSCQDLASCRSLCDRAEVLVIDDAHLACSGQRWRQMLSLGIQNRMRAKRPVLCTFSCATDGAFRNWLPHPRNWHIGAIRTPGPSEREQVLSQLCVNTGVVLSSEAVKLVAKLVSGDGHSLFGALSRIRLGLAGETGRGPVNPLRVVGLLHPYFADALDFDLRDVILDSVARGRGAGYSFAPMPSARATLSLAVYVMGEVAGLSECAIASYFGIEPALVYRLRRDTGRRLAGNDPGLRAQVDRALALVTTRLCEQ